MPQGAKTFENPKFFHGGGFERGFMEDGSVWSRVKLHDGTQMLYSEQRDYQLDSDLPWGEPYFHRGHTEVNTLVEGWAHFIYGVPTKLLQHSRLTSAGQVLTFQPNVPHVVLLGPKSKLITSIFGTGVPNLDHRDEDWWPADGAFAYPALLEQERVQEEFLVAAR